MLQEQIAPTAGWRAAMSRGTNAGLRRNRKKLHGGHRSLTRQAHTQFLSPPHTQLLPPTHTPHSLTGQMFTRQVCDLPKATELLGGRAGIRTLVWFDHSHCSDSAAACSYGSQLTGCFIFLLTTEKLIAQRPGCSFHRKGLGGIRQTQE